MKKGNQEGERVKNFRKRTAWGKNILAMVGLNMEAVRRWVWIFSGKSPKLLA